MSDRYDEHLSFDLPYGYEAAVGGDDSVYAMVGTKVSKVEKYTELRRTCFRIP